MRNDSSVMLSAIARARGLLRSSEPSLLSPAAPQATSLLEEAAELLVWTGTLLQRWTDVRKAARAFWNRRAILTAAEGLIQDCKALSQEQQEDMHKTLQEKKHQWLQKEEASPIPEEHPEMSWKLQLGSATQRILNILVQLRRMLESLASQFSSLPFKKTLLVAFLLCLIVVRLDPASPTSLPFLYRLTQLFHQARLALFPSSRRPPVQD